MDRIDYSSEQSQPNISLCLIVKNELQNLKKNLSPLIKEFQEVVIVDTGSDDGTREYLELLPDHVKVIDFVWIDNFSAARNQYLKAATLDWIYWMDADEYLDPSHVSILKDCSEKGEDTAWSYKYGHWASESHIKLFPNVKGIHYVMRCHEQIRPSLIQAGIKKFLLLPAPFKIVNPSYAKIPEESQHRNIRLLQLDIREKPEYLMSYVHLAYIYCEFAEYDKAIEVLTKALSQKSPKPNLEYLRAQRAANHAMQIIALQKSFHEKVDRGEDLSREELEELGRLARQDPY